MTTKELKEIALEVWAEQDIYAAFDYLITEVRREEQRKYQPFPVESLIEKDGRLLAVFVAPAEDALFYYRLTPSDPTVAKSDRIS